MARRKNRTNKKISRKKSRKNFSRNRKKTKIKRYKYRKNKSSRKSRSKKRISKNKTKKRIRYFGGMEGAPVGNDDDDDEFATPPAARTAPPPPAGAGAAPEVPQRTAEQQQRALDLELPGQDPAYANNPSLEEPEPESGPMAFSRPVLAAGPDLKVQRSAAARRAAAGASSGAPDGDGAGGAAARPDLKKICDLRIEKLQTIQAKAAQIQGRLVSNNDLITQLKRKLADCEKQLGEKDQRHTAAIRDLEAQKTALGDKIGNLEDKMKADAFRIQKLEEKYAALKIQFHALRRQVRSAKEAGTVGVAQKEAELRRVYLALRDSVKGVRGGNRESITKLQEAYDMIIQGRTQIRQLHAGMLSADPALVGKLPPPPSTGDDLAPLTIDLVGGPPRTPDQILAYMGDTEFAALDLELDLTDLASIDGQLGVIQGISEKLITINNAIQDSYKRMVEILVKEKSEADTMILKLQEAEIKSQSASGVVANDLQAKLDKCLEEKAALLTELERMTADFDECNKGTELAVGKLDDALNTLLGEMNSQTILLGADPAASAGSAPMGSAGQGNTPAAGLPSAPEPVPEPEPEPEP
jgi:hypothetical protein